MTSVGVPVPAHTEVAGRLERRAAVGARRAARLHHCHGPRCEGQCGLRLELHAHDVGPILGVGRQRAGDRGLVLVLVVHLVLVGHFARLDDHALVLVVPAQAERAHPELLDDRFGEWRRRADDLVGKLQAAVAQRHEQHRHAFREHRDLDLLERHRDDPLALAGLQEEGALTRLAKRAADETVGLVERKDASRHEVDDSNTLWPMQFKTVSSAPGEGLDAVIVPVFRDTDEGEPQAAAAAVGNLRRQAEWLAREAGPGKLFGTHTHLGAGGEDGRTWRLIVVEAGKSGDFDAERAWQAISAGTRALWGSKVSHLGVCLETAAVGLPDAIVGAVEGVLFAMWDPQTHKTAEGSRRLPPLEEVLLIAGAEPAAEMAQAAIALGEAVGEAVNWARARSNEPANKMTPTDLAAIAHELAEAHNLGFAVIEEDEAAQMGMGSYLSVARGSDEPAKFIVMRYHGRDADGYDLALVGKGITFDSGGISLKDPQNMYLMKHDMAGAAAVLGSMGAIARLGLPLNVICVAPATENLPGGHATKPGDVFTSLSGKTIEVINTDAEGRLVLIDGVAYAQREGARRVVDVATLTGAIGVALGRHYSGAFGRPEAFVQQITEAGKRAGERMWPMPLDDEFREDMKSDIADLRNTGGRMGGASLGAAFIDAGVDPATEWVHLDIAGTAWSEDEQPYAPKGPQGTPVRTLVELASSIAGRGH